MRAIGPNISIQVSLLRNINSVESRSSFIKRVALDRADPTDEAQKYPPIFWHQEALLRAIAGAPHESLQYGSPAGQPSSFESRRLNSKKV
mmetsp:Transcript_26037/g.58682  ORF Transcript_26037/g.58682 Transcript_26037/m.58682 type:complete len:90 (-) Transcript_26037:171-440(-)